MTARIAVSGKICSGKSAAASALIEDLGFARVALADELKAVAVEIADWIHAAFIQEAESLIDSDGVYLLNLIRDRLKDKASPQGRAFLQRLGTDCLRKRLPDIWVQILKHRVADLSVRMVTDDVRFVNEAEGLRAVGFRLVRIETPEAVRKERVERLYPRYRNDPSVFLHRSEVELDTFDSWDATFDGSLPLDEFRRQIVAWASEQVLKGVA